MDLRSPRGLFIIFSAIQAIGEFVSATYIEVWMYALVFGVLFLLGAALVQRGRVPAGSGIGAVLSLFELANYPFWLKTGAFDWLFDTFLAVAAAATLVAVGWIFTARRRVAVTG